MLEIQCVSKSFDKTAALSEVSFSVAKEEIVAILGTSGCGKSTLLNIIAGLMTAEDGTVCFDGKPITDIPPHQRNFGLMIQDYALFPHRDVFGNVAFGLQQQSLPLTTIQQKVTTILKKVGLTNYSHRDVNTLSGGEQQRVALARALAPQPRLLMLDEPLGSLDRPLREHLLSELSQILRALHQTAIYVTHDQEEAFTIADRIIIMRSGKIKQVGTPNEIYTHPASEYVARFLGMTNIISATPERQNGEIGVQLPAAGWHPLTNFHKQPSGGHAPVSVLLRPTGAIISPQGNLLGKVTGVSFRGSSIRLQLQPTQSPPLIFELPTPDELPQVGTQIRLKLPPDAVTWLPKGNA